MTPRIAALAFASLLTLMGSCSQQVAGTGTETSSGERLGKIDGGVITTSGAPAFGAAVTLVPVLYNPVVDAPLPDSLTVFTDSAGSYGFDAVEPGTYNIQASRAVDGTRLLIRNVRVDSGAAVTRPAALLTIPGTVVATLPRSARLGAAAVFVRGTTIARSFDSTALATGRLVVDSLPATTLPPLMIMTNAITAILALGVDVPSLDTVRVSLGHTIHVSLTGSDTGDGLAIPFRTIARGCAALCVGDTLMVDSGTYTDNWPEARLVATSGLLGAPILITTNGRVLLQGDRNADSAFAIWEGFTARGVSNVVFEGFAFTDFLHGIRIDTSSHITVRRCTFVNNGYVGLGAVGSDSITIDGCLFIDSTSTVNLQDFGLFVDQTTRVWVRDCVFFGRHSSAAIAVETACADVSIARCVFEGAASTAIRVGYVRSAPLNTHVAVDSCVFRPAAGLPALNALFVQGVDGFTCSRCYFEGSDLGVLSTRGTLELKEDPRGIVRITGNTFAYLPENPAFLVQSSAADSVLFQNNTLYACGAALDGAGYPACVFVNNILSACAADALGAGNFRGDPLFAGPLAGQPLATQPCAGDIAVYLAAQTAPFRLTTGSPAVDVGTNVGLSFFGGAPDMGAFELGQ